MKNYFNLIIVLSFAFIFGACQKESNLSQTNNYDEIYNTQNERLDAGIYFAIGTTLPMNCKGNYHCGPCPGICVRKGKDLD